MANLFNTVLYQPLYNILIYFISIAPGENLGLAIIFLTILVKFVLLPLTHKQSKSQAGMKKIQPKIQEIQKKYKDDKQEQAKKTMELYKEHGINPFSGCLIMIVQIPVIIALYWVFFKGLKDGIIQTDILYSFVTVPHAMNTFFLGYFDLMDKSVIFALLAGITQFFQMKLAMPALPKPETSKTGELSFKDEFAKNMNTQFKYVMPVMITFFAYSISAAVALYWVVSNTFSIIHELIVKHEAEKIITNQEGKI